MKRHINSEDAAFATADLLGHHQVGLSKRELFAAMAMQGILANSVLTGDWKTQAAAETAVEAADALINALNDEAQDDK